MALFKEQPKRNGRCACCTNPRHNGYFKGTDQLTIQERRYAAPAPRGLVPDLNARHWPAPGYKKCLSSQKGSSCLG